MGQKVNPNIFRLGITRNWESSWYAPKKKYGEYIQQDILLRNRIQKTFAGAGGIGTIEIERSANKVVVNVYTSKPGVLIGKQGNAIQDLKTTLQKEFKEQFEINIKEIKKPYLDSRIVAEIIGQQISRRIPFRRAIKSVMERVTEAGAKGIKVYVGGRLNGVEIARNEYFLNGKIPLHTLRSDIDFAKYPAPTIYGQIGVKVWIYRGDQFAKKKGAVEGQKRANA